MRGGYRSGTAPRQRIGPVALTVALHILVVALLLFYKTTPLPRQVEQSLSTFFLPDKQSEEAEAAKAETRQQPKARDSEEPEQPEKPVEQPPPPAPEPVVKAPNYLTLTSAEFAAANIAGMPSSSKSRAKEGAGADSKAAYGPGEGPGGAQLYDPDWFRRPTSAELGGYLTANTPREGWGLIACQTIPRNRVDNCRTLGEFPLGSGFGKAVRDAAWQFQILPPRVNGRPVIGAWVRIRITYGEVNEIG